MVLKKIWEKIKLAFSSVRSGEREVSPEEQRKKNRNKKNFRDRPSREDTTLRSQRSRRRGSGKEQEKGGLSSKDLRGHFPGAYSEIDKKQSRNLQHGLFSKIDDDNEESSIVKSTNKTETASNKCNTDPPSVDNKRQMNKESEVNTENNVDWPFVDETATKAYNTPQKYPGVPNGMLPIGKRGSSRKNIPLVPRFAITQKNKNNFDVPAFEWQGSEILLISSAVLMLSIAMIINQKRHYNTTRSLFRSQFFV